MNPFIRDIILEHKTEIMERWSKEIKKFRSDDSLQNISDTMYENTNQEFGNKLILTVQTEGKEYHDDLIQFAERLIQLGWPLNYITRGLQEFRKIIVESLSETGENYCKSIEFFQEIESWIDDIVNLLVNQYSGSWENTVFLQKMALKELSAPLIPVFQNISVMPLIGTIDTERAKLIMENLLEGVIEHRSQVVLIDITGVPVVDTMVAHHIIQASEAVRLVGAKCILVGIRPEIAQTIVNLGIDLGKFPTKSTLKKGIEAALEITKKQIVDLEV
ncbi:STAS domain-containing protein [Salipaludibacillus agaradhaerens]|uniref:STAS domain-containing protein n=1 Tax=Salipaludibacillus agaradhaerens TaxID=76935 RepID=A0A9Q4B3S2_SALAG|nr:RsbT co-antagonist protein RsbRA [Salipaludibacillus agaradhaerens]MCR6097799.1 STAS domain-containing protein [Salipaludibacillus agaradhaerens]MCR6116572.1 STAS domain-containing protein [Salipaludibacillus agaradhaerens]UJW56581.1 STAS domain-containing protein [Bacillus sp. A116_S68]